MMKRIGVILITVFVLLATACERRELVEMNHVTKIAVKVNIDAVANVTCDVYNEKIQVPKIEPSAMHVLFYEAESEKVAAESFISEVGVDTDGKRVLHGNISIMPGNYKMLIYDFGTESTIVENYYKWKECRAYTNEISPALKGTLLSKADPKAIEEAYIVYEPDHLVVATSENEYIPYHEGIHTIQADAMSVVESYYLQIKVKGLEYVSSAQAILSGMVNANKISSNTKVIEPQATIWFDLEKSDDKGVPVICTVFNTFGRIEDSQNDLEVTFDIKTHDGRTVQEKFDISELFHTEECIKHHWLLLEETIEISPPISSGGGFNPEVGDWDEEHHDIYL